MNYYCTLDTNSIPNGFYNDDVYPPNKDGTRNAAIPSGAITITQSQWLTLISNQKQYQVVNGALVSYVAPPRVPTANDVDNERDRRMYGGYLFNSVLYQTDSTAITNVLGCMQLATLAISQGVQAGNLRWADQNTDFYWIATDNTSHTMDAQTVVAFALAIASFRTKLTYTARGIKNAMASGTAFTMDTITANQTWGMGDHGASLT